MGFSAAGGGHKSGRGKRGVPRYGAMAEINMTPFIDVMLVLLIIFMVAAPLLTTGVPIDLPQTKAGALNVEQKPIAIAVNEAGEVFLMDQPITPDQLLSRLKETAHEGFDERIYIRGAKGVNYGRVAEILSLVTTAGYKKVALLTETEHK